MPLNFVPEVQINNIPTLVQIMVWCLPGHKPLSEPITVRWLRHIRITRPQWVKKKNCDIGEILYILLNIPGQLCSSLVITVPADALVPNGAEPSAGAVLTTKLDKVLSMFFLLALILVNFWWYIQNGHRDLTESWWLNDKVLYHWSTAVMIQALVYDVHYMRYV